MKKIVETKKLDTDKIKVWGLKFDKDAYDKMVLDVLIEQEAKQKEEELKKEREMIKSWIFTLTRKNIANWNEERMELLNHIDFLISNSEDNQKKNYIREFTTYLKK